MAATDPGARAVMGQTSVEVPICCHGGDLPVGVAVDEALVPDGDALLAVPADEVAALRELR